MLKVRGEISGFCRDDYCQPAPARILAKNIPNLKMGNSSGTYLFDHPISPPSLLGRVIDMQGRTISFTTISGKNSSQLFRSREIGSFFSVPATFCNKNFDIRI